MRLLLTGDCHQIVVKLVFREVRKKKKKKAWRTEEAVVSLSAKRSSWGEGGCGMEKMPRWAGVSRGFPADV